MSAPASDDLVARARERRRLAKERAAGKIQAEMGRCAGVLDFFTIDLHGFWSLDFLKHVAFLISCPPSGKKGSRSNSQKNGCVKGQSWRRNTFKSCTMGKVGSGGGSPFGVSCYDVLYWVFFSGFLLTCAVSVSLAVCVTHIYFLLQLHAGMDPWKCFPVSLKVDDLTSFQVR